MLRYYLHLQTKIFIYSTFIYFICLKHLFIYIRAYIYICKHIRRNNTKFIIVTLVVQQQFLRVIKNFVGGKYAYKKKLNKIQINNYEALYSKQKEK